MTLNDKKNIVQTIVIYSVILLLIDLTYPSIIFIPLIVIGIISLVFAYKFRKVSKNIQDEIDDEITYDGNEGY